MNILTVLALLLVPASPIPVSTTSAQAAMPPVVVVKIGTASLEEYTHGDPSNRVQLLSGSQSAKKL